MNTYKILIIGILALIVLIVLIHIFYKTGEIEYVRIIGISFIAIGLLASIFPNKQRKAKAILNPPF